MKILLQPTPAPMKSMCVAGLILAVLSRWVLVWAGEQTQSIINCDIQNSSCCQMVAGRKVTLDVLPRPVQAMQDLTFQVTLEGAWEAPESPYIDLNMPAMDMGRNRVPLTRTTNGIYVGQGVIVRCISNLKTWQAKITFPGLGRAYFIFDVVY